MGYCCLPPESIELKENSKKERNGKVKWAKSQDGLLLFTPCKSQTNSSQHERNKWYYQNKPRVKMGQGLRWATVVYPLKESN